MAAFQSAAIELLPATLDRLADVHPSLLVEVLEMEAEPGHPASTTFEFREVRGRDDPWVAEVSISYDQGPWNFGVGILGLRGDKIARESIYATEGWEPPEWRAQ